jgi:hypothetical protein
MFFLARGDAQVTYLVLNVRDEGVFFFTSRDGARFLLFQKRF